MILYGPEGSGIRSTAGVFASGRCGPEDFVPPSAIAHARSLYGDVVRWRDPDLVRLPMDVVFIEELVRANRKFASTNELTCFKFNAAWRRDAYKVKSVAEQMRMLNRIESGVDFRQAEMIDVLRSVVAFRFVPVNVPRTEVVREGEYVRRNRRYKGLDKRFDPDSLQRIDRAVRFDTLQQEMPFEWYGAETHPTYGSFRWTGPNPRATINLPVLFDRDFKIRIHIISTLRPDLIDKIGLAVHGHPLEVRISRSSNTFTLKSQVRQVDLQREVSEFSLTIDAIEVAQPAGSDRRWLGLAVNWIELEPQSNFFQKLFK
jgi:hypothetical protein